MSGASILQRLDAGTRDTLEFELNGRPCLALQGDTVLSAVLTQSTRLRHSEFSSAARAGFCMMGACQDCWVQLVDGERLRACTTLIEPGMRIRT